MTKVFVGGRLRRMREDRGYTQVGMARELGLSASYYNQIENDERPLTAQLIVRVSELLKVDAQLFADDQEGRLIADMREVLVAAAPEEEVSLAELREVASTMPGIARALIKIQHKHREALERVDLLSHQLDGARDAHAASLPLMPHEEVRDFFYARSNYIDELDRVAERIASDEALKPGETFDALARRLDKLHGIKVSIEREDGDDPAGVLQRRFEQGKLVLSPGLTPTQRAFQVATQLAFLEAGDKLKKLASEGSFTSDESRALARIGLAHHFAGALLMPYRAFLAAAEQLRYDLDPLRRKFGVSYEMVCHRVSTLQRSGAEGVPFFFLRVDRAGNISKRQSATDFHFSRVGGTCPLWNVYEAFAQPGRTLVQLAQMPDGRTYLWIARAVSRGYGGHGSPSKTFSIALGCDVRHAPRLVYSQGLDLRAPAAVTPIGMGCKVCDRPACPQRAFPQMGRHVVVDENRSHFEPYFAEPKSVKGASR
jgi:predicted transcriptional regulator/transcriptional regulator with XRE-family HTH domain